MSEVNRYSISAGGTVQNASGYFPEGQAPSTVNDAARTVMADLRRYVQTQRPELTASYSGQTYSVTFDREISSGELAGVYTFIADTANTGSAILSVNTFAKALKQGGIHLPSSAIDAQDVCVAAYNKAGDYFDLVSPRKQIARACAFYAVPSGDQTSVVSGSGTQVLFATESYDYGGNFASSAFVAPATGVYRFSTTVQTLTTITDGLFGILWLSVNGATTPLAGTRETLGVGSTVTLNLSWEGPLTAGDSVAVYFRHNLGSDATLDAVGQFASMHFGGSRVA